MGNQLYLGQKEIVIWRWKIVYGWCNVSSCLSSCTPEKCFC